MKASAHTAPISSVTVREMPVRLSETSVNMLRARTAVTLRTWPLSALFTFPTSNPSATRTYTAEIRSLVSLVILWLTPFSSAAASSRFMVSMLQ